MIENVIILGLMAAPIVGVYLVRRSVKRQIARLRDRPGGWEN